MRNTIRDIHIVFRGIWLNLALFAGLIAAASVIMLVFGCFPGKTFGELLVKALYMTRVEGAMDGSTHSPLTVALVYIVPILAVLILGEGALRVAGLYINRKSNRGEWEKLMVQSLSGHIVLCGAGELGRTLLNRLHEKDPGQEIVVVDTQPDILSDVGIHTRSVHAICGNMTSREILMVANAATCSTVIITSGDDAHNLETAFKVLEINENAQIRVRLYHSGLSKMMNSATHPNIHFFSPYETAAAALAGEIDKKPSR